MDLGHIENSNYDNNDKIVVEEKALKTGFKKQFKGKCRVCGKIGNKGANKDKRPANNHGRENGEKKYNFTGTCNYCHKRDIKKQNVALS